MDRSDNANQRRSRPTDKDVDRVTIRFAGDSGDGMQLTGTQFTKTSAVFGNDISTVPDIPAEIRAPQGSLPGVSAFQVSFSSFDIYTPGDEPDVLVAMNPAALKVHLPDLPARRHDHRQHGRVQRRPTSRRPATRPTRWMTTASAPTASTRCRSAR